VIEVSYRISEEEAIRVWTRIGFNRAQRFFTLAFTVGCVVVSGLTFMSGELEVGGILLATGILVPTSRWLLYKVNCRRNFRGAPFMREEVAATFSEYGTRMSYSNNSSETRWDGYVGYYEFEDAFVLMLSNALNRIVLKRAFTVEQLHTVDALLRSKLARLRS
jgi:hypothetical protein